MSELAVRTIRVSGQDAFDFLQNQLTSDLARLDDEAEILSAWCNPKGRVIWFGTVRKTDSGFALSAPAETAQDIVEHFGVFRFRSKVEFAIENDTVSIDPAFLVANGFAFVGRDQVEAFTPHMLNLDLVGAVSLDKGCYPGQEIVARTHYRGRTKRRLFRYSSAAPAQAGDKIVSDGRTIGEVVNAAGNELLAVVPIDQADGELGIGSNRLLLLSLPYSIDNN